MNYLADPIHFTNYNRTDDELELAAIFSVLVAGHNALATARALEKLILLAKSETGNPSDSPFEILRVLLHPHLTDLIHRCGIGCHNAKARTVGQLVHAAPNLRTVTAQELESFWGIGPKTSRFFLLHTRPNQRLAVLDVHVLRYLRSLGHNAPQSAPGSSKRYAALEQICLNLADAAGLSPAEWDLHIWNSGRTRTGVNHASQGEIR